MHLAWSILLVFFILNMTYFDFKILSTRICKFKICFSHIQIQKLVSLILGIKEISTFDFYRATYN